eukprot:126248-Chlamydomonas_euryale.AAC.11
MMFRCTPILRLTWPLGQSRIPPHIHTPLSIPAAHTHCCIALADDNVAHAAAAALAAAWAAEDAPQLERLAVVYHIHHPQRTQEREEVAQQHVRRGLWQAGRRSGVKQGGMVPRVGKCEGKEVRHAQQCRANAPSRPNCGLTGCGVGGVQAASNRCTDEEFCTAWAKAAAHFSENGAGADATRHAACALPTPPHMEATLPPGLRFSHLHTRKQPCHLACYVPTPPHTHTQAKKSR